MSLEVYLSPLAEQKLLDLLNFLESHWVLRVKNRFIDKFKKSIDVISKFPLSSVEVEEFKGVRKCLVTKQTSFYYRIYNGEIEIITVFDNRQNPNTVLKELRDEL